MLAVRLFPRALRAVASRTALALAPLSAFALADFAAAAQDRMGDFMHKPVAAVQTALGDRATFLGPDLKATQTPDSTALVQWQSPLPGGHFGEGAKATFVFSKMVRVPELVGMPAKLAKETLESVGLYIEISDLTCDSGCHVPAPDELEGHYVDEQCTIAGSWVAAGTYVCVVVEPAGESSPVLFFALIVVIGAGFALAFVVWLRLRSAREELRQLRAGTAPRRDEPRK